MVSLGGWFFEFGIEGCGLRGSGPVTGVVVKKDSGSRLLPIPPGWKLERGGTLGMCLVRRRIGSILIFWVRFNLSNSVFFVWLEEWIEMEWRP